MGILVSSTTVYRPVTLSYDPVSYKSLIKIVPNQGLSSDF